MKKTLKVLLWIMAVILFPITVGLYFIWPGRIFKDRMTQNWNLFWWLIYILVAVPCVTFKITLYFWFLTMGFGMEGFSASVSRENVQPSEYRTGEDFHKLTGVEFPELEMVDSLFFQDGCLPSSWWNEYKFVVKGGLSDRFKNELERACLADPTHWSHTEGCISDTKKPLFATEYIYPSAISNAKSNRLNIMVSNISIFGNSFLNGLSCNDASYRANGLV